MRLKQPIALAATASLVFSASLLAQPQLAHAAGCKPSFKNGRVSGYSHDGARTFVREVTVYNSCSDTTWTLDIRPAHRDKKINPQTGKTSYYSIASSWTIPYVHGIKSR